MSERRSTTRESMMVRGRSIECDEEVEVNDLIEMIMPTEEEAIKRSQGVQINLSIKKQMENIYTTFYDALLLSIAAYSDMTNIVTDLRL